MPDERYIIRHEDYGGAEWLHVIDTQTSKLVQRFYGWDSGWPEAYEFCKQLNAPPRKCKICKSTERMKDRHPLDDHCGRAECIPF